VNAVCTGKPEGEPEKVQLARSSAYIGCGAVTDMTIAHDVLLLAVT
jgi:hypothetical protein